MIVDPSVVYTREQVVANLKNAVASSPVSFDFLLKQAEIESGLNPQAKAATSSASGPFQFVKGTWLRMVEKYGDHVGLSEQAAALRDNSLDAVAKADLLALRHDVQISGKMAAHFALDNAKTLASSGIAQIGPTELYLAHFLGAGGAKDFLAAMQANPQAPAAEAVPAAAQANTNVFYANGVPRSFSEIYNRFAQKFAGIAAPLKDNGQNLLGGDGAAVGAIGPSRGQDPTQPALPLSDPRSLDGNAVPSFEALAQQVLAESRAAQAAVQRAQGERGELVARNTAEVSAAVGEMNEAALSHYLASFSRNFEDPTKAPIETRQVDIRDASRGASDEAQGRQDGSLSANVFGSQDVSTGVKIVMDTAGRPTSRADHAAAEVKTAVPVTAPAVKQAVQWVSLFSDTRGADAAQAGRA